MSAPARRSGRARKETVKYLESGWSKETLRILRESSESSGSSISDESGEDNEESDAEFESRGLEDAENATSSSSDEGEPSDASSASFTSSPTSAQSDDEVASVTFHASETPVRKRRRISPTVGAIPCTTGVGRFRGIQPVHRKSSKHVVYPRIFGPGIADLRPILHVRETWLTTRDVTLPSRSTLQTAFSFSHDDTSVDITVDKDAADFIDHQVDEIIEHDKAKAGSYLNTTAAKQSVVLGAAGKQKLFNLDFLCTLDVSRAWHQAAAPQTSPFTQHSSADTFARSDRGWILNVGEKVQSLVWLPLSDTSIQILAVACRSTSQQRSVLTAGSNSRSPAFSPSASYPTSIQLWSVDCGLHIRNHNAFPKVTSSPALRAIYAVDCGDIRELKCQPLPSSTTSSVVAALSTDGSIRLLSMNSSLQSTSETTYVRVKQPALRIAPPSDAIFASMAWASNTDLIVGDTTGKAHIYNIETEDSPTPFLTVQLHNTYIMNLVSTYPSSISTIIASTSASGDTLLTDLRAPHQDRVHIHKARLPTKPLTYCHLSRSIIYPSETSGITDPRFASAPLIICNHIRHLHTNLQVCRIPAMSGSVTALASSPHHPCLLIANTKGSVFATNHARRTLPVGTRKKGAGGYLQKILDFDWRPVSPDFDNIDDNATAETHNIDLYHGHDVRPGISRFTEGFAPEAIDLTSGGSKNPRFQRQTPRDDPLANGAGGGKAKSSDANAKKAAKRAHDKARRERMENSSDLAAEVVFEEEQAVTALEWNPNRGVAGWAAMGWGSGIVRVMDLSHDAV